MCVSYTELEVSDINTYLPSSSVTIWVMKSYSALHTITDQEFGVSVDTRTYSHTDLCGHAWIYSRSFTGPTPDADEHTSVYNLGGPDEVTIRMNEAGGTHNDGRWILGCWFSYDNVWGTLNYWTSGSLSGACAPLYDLTVSRN